MVSSLKIKKWGNSFGIIIPNEIVRRENLKEGEEIIVNFEKKLKVKDIFGILAGWKIDTQKLKEELREKDWKRENIF